MDLLIYFIVLISLVNKSVGVPPSPTDRLWEELSSAKNVMTNIAVQLEKFNSLYLMKLEQKINTITSTLTSIDSNVKNLQERAHVWDTFQLHVSAWNEQINTLDKKVEIISKGQEKMLILDGKMQSISNIDYKTERINVKLDENLSSLQTIMKIVENQHDSLLGEFTTRGVLSTLKTIERKLDKLQIQHSSGQTLLAKQLNDSKKQSDIEQKGKLLIKCNTPPIVEELLSDVASKVDVMFDKFSSKEEQNDQGSGEENTSEVSQEKSDPDLKLIKSLLKRLNQPCKRTIKVLENLETSIKGIDNTTIAILEDEQALHTDLINYHDASNKKLQTVNLKTSDLIEKIEKYINLIETKTVNDQTLSNLFLEQREHFREILKDQLVENCARTSVKQTESIDKNQISKESPIYAKESNCNDLELTDINGVYIFDDDNQTNPSRRSFNQRYCEITQDEQIWTVIQRRGSNLEAENFNLSWTDYKYGFGNLDEDFWFGNEFIHALSEENLILRVELEDFEGNMAWAEYSIFSVAGEAENYQLTIGGYQGNASDSFSSHNNASFSTYDRKNDDAPDCCPCSTSYGGGWWFYSCFEANLNGIYYNKPTTNEYFRGIIWEHWLGNYSLKKTKMMVRPKGDSEIYGSGQEPIDSTTADNKDINTDKPNLINSEIGLEDDIPEDP